MKKNTIAKCSALTIIVLISFMFNPALFGQKEVVRETRDLPAFDQIDAGGAFDVKITIGEPQKVEVEAKQKDIEKIKTEVDGSKLVLSS